MEFITNLGLFDEEKIRVRVYKLGEKGKSESEIQSNLGVKKEEKRYIYVLYLCA